MVVNEEYKLDEVTVIGDMYPTPIEDTNDVYAGRERESE